MWAGSVPNPIRMYPFDFEMIAGNDQDAPFRPESVGEDGGVYPVVVPDHHHGTRFRRCVFEFGRALLNPATDDRVVRADDASCSREQQGAAGRAERHASEAVVDRAGRD